MQQTTLIPLFGIAIPMIIVPVALFARHVGRARHYRHVERMQALKAGVAPPSTVPLPGPGSVVAIGAGVPMACVLGAVAATNMLPFDTAYFPGTLAIVWGAAGLLGLCGLATSLVLGLLLHRANARAGAEIRDDSAKPAYDPDMFDAAHRGY